MTRSQALAMCFGLAVYLGCASTSRPASAEGAYRAFKRIGGAIAVGVEKPRYRTTQPAKFFCCIVRPGSSVGRAAD